MEDLNSSRISKNDNEVSKLSESDTSSAKAKKNK
jgi:hypothetical protein